MGKDPENFTTGFLGSFKKGIAAVGRRDDDGFDRLSNRYSVGVLIACALLISTKAYVGDPIDCVEPRHFNGQWIKYMDNVCWVSNTYYVPTSQRVPSGFEGASESLQYYQWVPILLTFQAFLFMAPTFLWDLCVKFGGYDVQAIVESCRDADNINPESRDKTMSYLVKQMARYLNYRRPHKKGLSLGTGKRYGVFLYYSYLVIKVLYIANAGAQIFFLSNFLGEEYKLWGFQTLGDMVAHRDWNPAPLFPRVTWCAFSIRTLGSNNHIYTVQCLLPVNLFNEKVFMFVWWWLAIVTAFSILGLLLWVVTASFPSSNSRFVKGYLPTTQEGINWSADVDDFTNDFLRVDGVFCLRIIRKNTNDLVCSELVGCLWDYYLEMRGLKPASESSPNLEISTG